MQKLESRHQKQMINLLGGEPGLDYSQWDFKSFWTQTWLKILALFKQLFK